MAVSARKKNMQGKKESSFRSKISDFFKSQKPVPRDIFIIVSLALVAIRLLLSLVPQSKIDPGCYMAWATYLNSNDFDNFYKDFHYAIYGPVYLFLMWLSGKIGGFLSITNNVESFGYLLKMWYVLFDLIGGYLIFKIGKKYKKEWLGLVLAIFYVLNPGVFVNSSVWGQLDTIIATMMLAAIYLINVRQSLLAVTVLMLAIMTKPQAGAVVPVLAIMFFAQFPWNKFASDKAGFFKTAFIRTGLAAVICILVYTVTFYPFYNQSLSPKSTLDAKQVEFRDMSKASTLTKTADFFTWLPKRYLSGVEQYPYATANAFNFWFIAGGQTAHYDGPFLGSTYKTFGTLLLALIILLTTLFMIFEFFIKKRKRVLSLYFISYFLTTAYVAFYTAVHERYLLPAVIFSTICIFWDKRFWIVTFLVSLCTFLNQFYIYYRINSDMNAWVPHDDKIGMITSYLTVITALISIYILFSIMRKNKDELPATAK
ncbi:MAG: hypothetical protein N2645_23510 [Clostridia bacterium]|nr:hypothetical protein [Clostridia bacterium]